MILRPVEIYAIATHRTIPNSLLVISKDALRWGVSHGWHL